MIDLAPLERAVAKRDDDRTERLLAALAQLERGELFDSTPAEEGFTRLASCLASVLTDPELALEAATAQALQTNSATINALFAASGFRSSAFAVAAAAPDFDGRLSRLSEAERRRLSPLLTLDTPGPFLVEDLFDLPPEEALLVALTLIGTSPVLTPLGAERRERLLAGAQRLAGARLTGQMVHVAVAAAAWMTCSYAEAPDRHRLKPVLNGILRRLLEDSGFRAPPPVARDAGKARPTMVVIAEVMRSGHVQYRYFGQYLRQLATRFRLVLVTPEREIDDHVKALFEDWFAFDALGPARFLNEIVGFVAAQAPDVVFWPSVGMARWGPLLANLRFAPIQMTALGHSASTFIPEMDYYLTEAGYVSDPALFSEKLLLLPDESLRFERPPRYEPVTPDVRERPDPVRIAVPSNALKLNPRFLEVLREIRARSGRAVDLFVFPNATQLKVAALRAASPFLREATIYPHLPAHAYLGVLNHCDLVLSPFPFGGLHSVVDALRQGLPVVAMEGAEPHARTDAMILRRLQMPEALITRSEGDYVAQALRLIEDDAWRLEVGRLGLSRDIDRLLFGDATTPRRSEVGDAVWAACRHHEAIMASDRRAWPLADLRALDEGRG